MKRILIIEDQPDQRINLERMLKNLGSDYSILSASCVKDALDISNKEDIDLFFIDIDLPDGNGLNLATELRKLDKYELTWIVFLTTYTQYILESFRRVHCYDYIVKPYEKNHILELAIKLTANSKTITSKSEESFLCIQLKGVILKINTSDIIFIEVFNKNCTIHTKRQKYELKRTPLSKLINMLPQNNFIQCHRSYAINISYVDKIQKTSGIWEVSFHEYDNKAYIGETFYTSVINTIKAKLH